jgi:hypothetical protein
MLPVRHGPLRFVVGHPEGLTSNSWIVWTSKRGDVYISCRDNFTEAKVSLHASGRWRMAFTETAVAENSNLLSREGKRTLGRVGCSASTVFRCPHCISSYLSTSGVSRAA